MSAMHILLVDDDDDIREIATISLETVGGWRVSSANCGTEGIAKALAEAPDAILLDVMMPDIDGPTTFGRLQDDPRTRAIPVIFLTAKAHNADRQRLEQIGVAGLLTKPFDPMTLAAEVMAILATAGDHVPGAA